MAKLRRGVVIAWLRSLSCARWVDMHCMAGFMRKEPKKKEGCLLWQNIVGSCAAAIRMRK